MDSPRKESAIQEAFSSHRIMHTNNTSTTIASFILDIFYTLTHWTVFGRDFLIRMARLQIEQNKSRINFLSNSRVDTDLRHGVDHATSLQWYTTFETGPWLKVWKALPCVVRTKSLPQYGAAAYASGRLKSRSIREVSQWAPWHLKSPASRLFA